MKLYLAGPMTGHKHFNFPAFDTAARYLRDQGYDVFSPADNDRRLLGKPLKWLPQEDDSEGPWKRWAIPGAPSLRVMLGEDLRWICEESDGVALLPGWTKSKGARAEFYTAEALGLKILFMEKFDAFQ